MEPIPLTWVMEGDYEVRLVMANVEDTIDKLAADVAAMTVGVCVPERDDAKLRIRIQGQDQLLPGDIKVEDSGLVSWDCIEVVYE